MSFEDSMGDSIEMFAHDILGLNWRDKVDPLSRAGHAAFGMPFTVAKQRAEDLGFATATAYSAYRTALRADYAASLRIADRAPATYLPLLNAFRSSTPTALTERT